MLLNSLSSSLLQTNSLLRATESGIIGIIPHEIGNLSSLFVLSLSANHLTGSIPTTITRFQKLQGLELSDNSLRGSIPTEFCHLHNLDSLFLRRNQFFGPVPACLGNVSSLRYLYLGGNKLSSSLPDSLWNLKDLLEFDVSSNSLSGYLPYGLGSLTSARLINLSANHFSGSISATIGGSPNLVDLSLAHNTLQGYIPETFKSLISLVTLDLSHNNLSGVIPKSLEALSHLRYFNISFNNLSGEIPSGGPFVNFTSQSFVSNEALCGLTQFGVPECRAVSLQRSDVGWDGCGYKRNQIENREGSLQFRDRMRGAPQHLTPKPDEEYGLGGSVSTGTDVYSYGIMLMETFTRTKPTDEMLAGGMTLRLWVKESLPNGITKVVDMALQRQEGEISTRDVQCLSPNSRLPCLPAPSTAPTAPSSIPFAQPLSPEPLSPNPRLPCLPAPSTAPTAPSSIPFAQPLSPEPPRSGGPSSVPAAVADAVSTKDRFVHVSCRGTVEAFRSSTLVRATVKVPLLTFFE
ncbi:hypothetical protein RJ640_029939 [Escallonia rubra]|uniref:Uncharacterized protein n=1 Tax=Escallonia rubra TaxID=112253 RepID=A0AA88RQB2_9ASTE|nr:hypothetical protein RJ640_029939 [Escallonia rubra]